jgi:hypothetical protein
VENFPIIKRLFLEENEMTKEMKISIMEDRLNKIKTRPDAFKSPGVMRKIERQIRNLKKSGD